MALPRDELVFGFWPARQLRGEIPDAIQHPREYSGGDVLNIACTQTGLPASRQKALVRDWCTLLPEISVRTLVFSSKVSQELFDAACAVPGLEALSVKWSSIHSLQALSGLCTLRAFYLGSAPSVESLKPISRLAAIEHLFISGIPGPVDLSFVEGLNTLREFGVAAGRGHRLRVDSLQPLASLHRLELLWLVSMQIRNGGLLPLYSLRNLSSLRTTMSESAKDFQALCLALPNLKHFQRVG